MTLSEVGCQFWEPFVLVFAPAVLDSDVLAIDETLLRQALAESSQEVASLLDHLVGEGE